MIVIKFLAIIILILIVFLLILAGFGYIWFIYQANKAKSIVGDTLKEGFLELIREKYKQSKNK